MSQWERARPPTPIPRSRSPSVASTVYAVRYAQPQLSLDDSIITEALRPDFLVSEFHVVDSKFAFSIGALNKLINPKSITAFIALGGLKGLEHGLRTNRHRGLDVNERQLEGEIYFGEATAHVRQDFDVEVKSFTIFDTSSPLFVNKGAPAESFICRRQRFGDGRLLVLAASKWARFESVGKGSGLEILVCALVSLILSLYQDLKLRPEASRFRGLWKQDVTVMVLLCLKAGLTCLVAWYLDAAESSYKNASYRSRSTTIVRSGRLHEVLWQDVLVGDVVFVRPGDQILADGIVVSSAGLCCDESSATGESDLIWKDEAEEVYTALKESTTRDMWNKYDPFMLSGTRIEDGVGTYLVTSTGINSSWGKIMLSLRDAENPPKHPLNAVWIKDATFTTVVVLFLILFIKFLVHVRDNAVTPIDKSLSFLQLIQLCLITLRLGICVWILEITKHTRRWWTLRVDSRIVEQNHVSNQVNKVSTICVDLDAMLDHDASQVIDTYTFNLSCTGFHANIFPRDSDSESLQTYEQNKSGAGSSSQNYSEEGRDDIASLWKASLLATCHSREVQEHSSGIDRGVSPSERALVKFGKDKLDCDLSAVTPDNFGYIDFTKTSVDGLSDHGSVAVVEHMNGHKRAYVAGDPYVVLKSCRKVLACSTDGQQSIRYPRSERINDILNERVAQCASQGFVLLGFAYGDKLDSYPTLLGQKTQDRFDDIKAALVFLGFVAIKVKLQDGLVDSVKRLQEGGISVRLITCEGEEFAAFIARQCGILFAQGTVTSATPHMHFPETGRQRLIPRVCGLARAHLEPVSIFINDLKAMNETVMTVGATNIFQRARPDIYLAMGVRTKPISYHQEYLVSDSNSFDVVRDLVLSSRALEGNQVKVVSFALILTTVLVLLVVFSASIDSENQSVLAPAALIWAFLLSNTLGCSILGCDPLDPALWSEKPTPRNDETFKLPTLKVIFIQMIYQLAVVLTLTFGSQRMFGLGGDERVGTISVLVLSTFMWMQLFSLLGMLRLRAISITSSSRSTFLGLSTVCLLLISAIILTAMFGGQAFGIRRLHGYKWAVVVILGLIAPVITYIARRISTTTVMRIVPKSMLIKFFQPPIPTRSSSNYHGPRESQKEDEAIYHRIFEFCWSMLRFSRKDRRQRGMFRDENDDNDVISI